MKISPPVTMRLAAITLSCLLAAGAFAQTTTPPATTSGVPADPTAPTTASAPPAGTMTKSELKEQRKQQKRDEQAAKDNAKASKQSAKAKEANDKALQSSEKAGQTTAPPQ